MRTFALCLILLGCGPSYRVVTEYDNFNRLTITEMRDNERTEVGTSRTWWFDARRVVTKDSAYHHYLLVRFRGGDWFFLDEGPVRFMLDGVEVAGIEPGRILSREVGHMGLVYELVSYPVDPEVFRAIGASTHVTVRLTADTEYHDLTLSSENIRRFREFYAQYCR